jgi:hypothetical protein
MASATIADLASAVHGELEVNVTQLVRGSTLGEYSVLHESARAHIYSAVALVPTQCLVIEMGAFETMCALQPEIKGIVRKESTLHKHYAVHEQLLTDAYSGRRKMLEEAAVVRHEGRAASPAQLMKALGMQEAKDRALLQSYCPAAPAEEEAAEGAAEEAPAEAPAEALEEAPAEALEEAPAEAEVKTLGEDEAAFASALLALVESAAPDVRAVIREKLAQ